MKPASILAFEKTRYPSGVFSHAGEHLRVLTRDESTYTPPIRPEIALQKSCPIIVPTHRDLRKNRQNIENIMRLADGPVIFLCSGKAKKEDIAAIAKNYPKLTWTAIDGPYTYNDYGQNFETTYSSIASGSEKDVSQKRNLGLLIARLMGWKSIFFIDDDVTITKQQVYKAIDLLHHDNTAIVGFSARSFYDNSVAVHARRITNGPIDSFIGTGAMAIRTDKPILSFFPHVYNEDWLFLLVYCLFGSEDVVWAGTIKQRAFNPYRDVARAKYEEPGDILGESLVRLAMSIRADLHEEPGLEAVTAKLAKFANKAFWEGEINNRILFIQETRKNLRQKTVMTPHRRQAIRALGHSLERLVGKNGQGGIRAEELSEWTEAWVKDLLRWNKDAVTPGTCSSIPEAMKALGLTNEYLYSYTDVGTPQSLFPAQFLDVVEELEQVTNIPSSTMPPPIETVAPRSPLILEKLEHTYTAERYLEQKGYTLDHIVKSAANLRFDRPIVTLRNDKPNMTISMLVTPGESIEQISICLKSILRKIKPTVAAQFVVWVYGVGQYDREEFETYRNRIVARLVSETAGTNTFIRSSIIASDDSNVDHIIDDSLNEMAFAYWECKIPADHPVFVINSRNELLRYGTFWEFMRGEHKVARKTVAAYIQALPKLENQPLILSKEDDELALATARRRLVDASHVVPSSEYTSHVTKQMKQAQLTWLQTDDLAFNFQFHHKDDEDSIIPVQKAICICLPYTNDLPSNKHNLAREIITAAQTESDPGLRSCVVVIQAPPQVSWENIEIYRSRLMKAIELQNPTPDIIFTSLTYRERLGESSALIKKRMHAVISYVHWLQNPTQKLTIIQRTLGQKLKI
jgi:hypothetical protein